MNARMTRSNADQIRNHPLPPRHPRSHSPVPSSVPAFAASLLLHHPDLFLVVDERRAGDDDRFAGRDAVGNFDQVAEGAAGRDAAQVRDRPAVLFRDDEEPVAALLLLELEQGVERDDSDGFGGAVAGDLKPEFRTGTAGPTFTNADEMAALMSDPYVIPGVSDGGAHTKFFTGGSYPTDLLSWLVRDTGKMSLEEAHWHLSYLPAQAAGFTDRGYLREGAPADIVVYDLARLRRVPEWDFEVAHDFPANEWRRIQRAEGYRFILVNGEVTFEEGKCTGATPGRLLRNGRVGAALGSSV